MSHLVSRLNLKYVEVVDLVSFENLHARCSTNYYQENEEEKSEDIFNVNPVSDVRLDTCNIRRVFRPYEVTVEWNDQYQEADIETYC